MNSNMSALPQGLSLQVLRSLLFIPINEAASMFPNMTVKTWEKIEAGEENAPTHIVERFVHLYEWRTGQLIMLRQMLIDNPQATLSEFWPASMDQWMAIEDREPQYFRPCQSLYASLLTEFPSRFLLYPFDLQAFTLWSSGRPGTDELQAQYLAQISEPLTS